MLPLDRDSTTLTQVLIPSACLGSDAAAYGVDLERDAHSVKLINLPAILGEPLKRSLACERRYVEEEYPIISQELTTVTGELGDESQSLVWVVVVFAGAW